MAELKSIEEIAKECIEGLHGTGYARKRKLENEGYDYPAVAAKVKELRAANKKSIKESKAGTESYTKKDDETPVSKSILEKKKALYGASHFKDPVDKPEEEKEPALSPAEYFENVKGKITEETTDNCRQLYDATMKHLKKYMITGQKAAAKELYARCIYLEKEMKLLEKGVTKYVQRTDIDNFIDNVADECVCVIEMCNFDRPIPDDIIDKVAEVQDCFDQFYVVFTDYTGEARSKVAESKREKDPILFGNIFIDGKVSPKMYFIGDWVDDYCDLTLDKMISKIAEKEKREESAIIFDIKDESNLDEIETALFGTSKRVTARSVAGKD